MNYFINLGLELGSIIPSEGICRGLQLTLSSLIQHKIDLVLRKLLLSSEIK